MKKFAALIALALPLYAVPAHASLELATKSKCTTCHQVDKKLLGPTFKQVAAKYKGDAKAPAMLAEKIKAGGKGVWGQIPMPPNNVTPEEASKLAAWVLAQK